MNHYTSALQLMMESQNIVISSHKSPDGDAIGSSVALFQFLKALNKDSKIVLADAPTANLKWLSGTEVILNFDDHKDDVLLAFSKADLIVCLDYNAVDRIGSDLEDSLRYAKAKKIMIDHHQQPEDFCNITISETHVGSTCELIFELIDQNGKLEFLNQETAVAIYLGILTDTGSFRFPSVRPRTHQIAEILLKTGIKHAQIHQNVFDNNTVSSLKLRGYITSERLELLEKYPVAILSVSQAELDRFGYQKGDTDGLVNVALSIEGVKIAAFFTERDGQIKISLRSKDEYFVNTLCKEQFNGGGHQYASGGFSQDSLEQTIEKFKSVVQKYY